MNKFAVQVALVAGIVFVLALQHGGWAVFFAVCLMLSAL